MGGDRGIPRLGLLATSLLQVQWETLSLIEQDIQRFPLASERSYKGMDVEGQTFPVEMLHIRDYSSHIGSPGQTPPKLSLVNQRILLGLLTGIWVRGYFTGAEMTQRHLYVLFKKLKDILEKDRILYDKLRFCTKNKKYNWSGPNHRKLKPSLRRPE